MSDIFHGYERQYCELSANLSRKCTSVGLLSGEQKKQKVTELKSGIDEAESLIRRMDLEARSLPPSQTAALLAKLREYKSDLTNLKREVQKCAASNDRLTSREELLEAGLGDSLTTSDDQRGRLLLATDRLNESGNRIKESRVKLLETEELGVSMLHGLHQQRQTLLHATTTLYGADDNIGKSRKILNSMVARGMHPTIAGTLILHVMDAECLFSFRTSRAFDLSLHHRMDIFCIGSTPAFF